MRAHSCASASGVVSVLAVQAVSSTLSRMAARRAAGIWARNSLPLAVAWMGTIDPASSWMRSGQWVSTRSR